MENWKDIKGFEGFYQISNLGRVKSVKRVLKASNQFGEYSRIVKERILKPAINNHGYCNVVLHNKGSKTYSVHRLVALAFIANNFKEPQVNHINGIKTDNHVENLEWVDNSENQKHAYKKELNNPSFGNAKLSESEVLEIRNLYKTTEITQSELSRKFNVYKTTINKIVHNQTWTSV